MAIFLTIVSGVAIFVIGQTVQQFVLKPFQDFRGVMAMVSHKLKFWTNVLTDSGCAPDLLNLARGDMRDLSCNVESKYSIIFCKELLYVIGVLPSIASIRNASENLIRLSNAGGQSGYSIKNSEAIDAVKESLQIAL